jgi:hypothetical protein
LGCGIADVLSGDEDTEDGVVEEDALDDVEENECVELPEVDLEDRIDGEDEVDVNDEEDAPY